MIAKFHQLCRDVLASQSGGANIQFARSYARHGLRISAADEVRSQALYIRANLSGWRGPEAKATRAGFDQLIKELA